MQIRFERDGGFAGLLFSCCADTDELPSEAAEELRQLVEDSGFFNLQPGSPMPAPLGPPDTFRYRISLSDCGRLKSLSFRDHAVPAALRPLLNYLQQLALEQKRNAPEECAAAD